MVIIVLIGYTTYTKLSEKYSFSYEPNDRFQTYLTQTEPPKQLFFAGEEIPLHDRQVAKKLPGVTGTCLL